MHSVSPTGRRSSLSCPPWSRSSAWNRPWGPSSLTSPWSVRRASSTWSTWWKGEPPLQSVPPPSEPPAYSRASPHWALLCLVSTASCPSRPSCACTGSWARTSACTPSWPSERRPWTTTRPRTGSRGRRLRHEQRHIKPASMRKQPLRKICGEDEGRGGKEGGRGGEAKTEFRLVHLHWANAKVYHIVPLEQRKLCTTQWIYLTLFCPFLFQVCIRNLHLYSVSLVLKSYRKGIQ